jgi:hypothetical protein
VRPCPSGGWPPRPLPRAWRKLRLDLAALDVQLTRSDGGVQAAIALAARYGGEQTILLGFGDVRRVRGTALSKLLREAARLLEPWGADGRIELRSLRPAVRREALVWLAAQESLAVLASARRGIVVGATPAALAGSTRSQLGANRQKMLLLAARDGEHCVWCRTTLSHRSPEATVDHVRCRCDGGGNALDNLVLACARCNHRRSNRTAEDWLAHCLAVGHDVDTDAVAAAIRRSLRHHRQRLRRTAPAQPGWLLEAA